MRIRIFVSGPNLEQLAEVLEQRLEVTPNIEVVDLWATKGVVECIWDGPKANLKASLNYLQDAVGELPATIHKALVTQ